jgi:SWI/SNF-related matrix-associated actin-dependent regulator of chromatin subfamily A member 5
MKVYRLINAGSVEDQMLDRIRRKLFLSVKVMGGSDNSSADESSSLGSTELMDILRKGSSALSRSDNGLDLQKFLDADIETILENSRSREGARDAKIKREYKTEIKDEFDGETVEKLLKSAEEEERALLSGIATVRCRLFEGKMVPQNNKAIGTLELASGFNLGWT